MKGGGREGGEKGRKQREGSRQAVSEKYYVGPAFSRSRVTSRDPSES